MIDYDPHDWRSHLLDIKGSVVKQIAWRVLMFTAWAGVVFWWHQTVTPTDMPATGHTLVGVALGLLLVFRTNTSYDRFWEGRKQWGALVNSTRNFARTVAANLPAAPAARLVRWCAAFPVTLMNHLRKEPAGETLDGAGLEPAVVERILRAEHVPLAAANVISSDLVAARRAGHMDERMHVLLEQHLAAMVDVAGACERIRNTPLPFAYVVHLRRCLLLYLATLPFAMVGGLGWEMIPMVAAVGYIMLGIDEIGVEIENPFGRDDNDLPLERFCAVIANNLREIRLALAPDPAAPEMTSVEVPAGKASPPAAAVPSGPAVRTTP